MIKKKKMKGEKMKDEGEKKMTGGGVKCLFLSVVINLFWAGHLLYWLGNGVATSDVVV